jgi:hypothetical protein
MLLATNLAAGQSGRRVMEFFVWCSVLVFIAVLIAAANVRRREMDRNLRGVLEKKAYRQVTLTTGVRNDYEFWVRTGDGTIELLYVNKDSYHLFDVGDQIVKQPGRRWPNPPPMSG